MPDPVTLTREGDVAVIMLDAPPVNAISQEVFEALAACVREVAASDARALLTLAEGSNFCGGADPAIFAGRDYASGSALVADLMASIQLLESLPYPRCAPCRA